MSKNLIAYVYLRQDNFCFNIITYNLTTGNQVRRYSQDVKDLITFFDNPPNYVKNYVKGIVFAEFGIHGAANHDLCEQLSTKLNALNIPFRFMGIWHITAMSRLIGAKIDPDVDKEILQIHVLLNDTIRIILLNRTENGYLITKSQQMPMSHDPKVLLESSNPSKIIISNATLQFPNTKVATLKSCLSKWKPFVFDRNDSRCLFYVVKETVDHMYNVESSKKYFIIPQLFNDLGVFAAGEKPSQDDILLVVKNGECLPKTQSCIVSRFHKRFHLLSKPIDPSKSFELPHDITKDGHRYKLTLSVDLNNFPTITHEAVILSKIKNMPKRLKIETTEKLPIIGFFDNSSVICVWNEEESCYKYLDSWNGKFGKDLFLDFMLPKPTLISSSTEVTSLSGAVYDLIKIMSMPPNNVKTENHWKFTFTKNDENPLLSKFDTFENERKAATPAFLMALTLKKHIRAIRKEIGGKPKKLGFRLFDDFENPEAKKRVEAGLQEACEWKKIECCFI